MSSARPRVRLPSQGGLNPTLCPILLEPLTLYHLAGAEAAAVWCEKLAVAFREVVAGLGPRSGGVVTKDDLSNTADWLVEAADAFREVRPS
ncbi:hypothetical protein SR39_13605 [Methylobacterium radiotolerans]|nr:hypothetical protein SR39_13605 [Methylobacterium radiotolerans]